jgi:hypothetical protein
LLLVIICVVAGLRIGADSAAAYIDDVHRINKTLADQNCELQIANADLLDQLSSEISASAATSSEEVSGPRF